MLDQIIIIGSQAKGAFIGATTGIVHETYIVVRKKNRVASVSGFLLAVGISAFVGFFTYGGLEQAGVEGFFLVMLTMIFSANSFVVFQLITNPSFLFGLIKVYSPKIKIPEEELKKFNKEI